MHVSLLAIAAVALAVASDEITIQPRRGDKLHSAWQVSASQINQPSERTLETLRRSSLLDTYKRDPERALKLLQKSARAVPDADLVYALAELSWVEGRRAESRRKGGEAALDHYTGTVAYAFDYLFDPRLAAERSPIDPRYRLACDLYNAALDRLLRAATTKDRIKPGQSIQIRIQGSERTMSFRLWPGSAWKSEELEELLLASDFELKGDGGLIGRSRRYGIGVPLIAVRRKPTSKVGMERYYPPTVGFALTAVLRPTHPLGDPREGAGDEARECQIDLFDPIQVPAIGEASNQLALDADFTTPLAYTWSQTDLDKYRWTGLFRPGQASERAGLMLLRPYEPDKIPVVMVHGLISSPLAWIPMLNELLRDPVIHQKYQFFLYMYPTGMPVPIAASGLRDALQQARQQFNPDGANPKFDQMVLLGHSMGGLLSHAMTVRSDEYFWHLYTDRSFSEILGPPEILRELDHYAHFDWVPSVKRVVFLATPHRGSDYSRKFVGRVGSGLISEPDSYVQLLDKLVKDNPEAFPKRFRHLPTSIETLEPDSPVLLALLRMSGNPQTKLHSVIGSIRPEARANTTDGIVPYKSAHLDGVASEVVVRSDHGVQKNPEAIREVRRILLEHVGEVAPPGVAAQPAPEAPAARR